MGDVTVIGLGAMSPERQEVWRRQLPSCKFVVMERPAPSGERLRQRALGIGLDSLALALRASPRLRGPVLALNPWPAFAARSLGAANLACTGLYAEPGSNSWRLLRRRLGAIPVIAVSQIESRAWNRDGGRSVSVLWGGTFGVPLSKPPEGRPRIFIGGTSDRDSVAISRFSQAVQSSAKAIDVVIADGTGPRRWARGESSITWLPYVSQREFLDELVASNVTYLALQDKGRAAGHMVLVSSLEAGMPIVVPRVAGIREYLVDGVALAKEEALDRLDQLLDLANAGHAQRLQRRHVWERLFSQDAHVAAVVNGLEALNWP